MKFNFGRELKIKWREARRDVPKWLAIERNRHERRPEGEPGSESAKGQNRTEMKKRNDGSELSVLDHATHP